jgi:hypothetical protein
MTTTQAPAPIDATLTLGDPAPNLPAVTDATPALIDTDNDPWQGVSDGDLTGDAVGGRLPFYALNRKAGYGFLDPDTGAYETEMDAVLLGRIRTRAQWNRKFGDKAAVEAPDCRSFDGITSDPNSPDRKAEKCATCPLSKWDGDEPPKCKESIELMVFMPDSTPGGGRLARVRFGGLAVSPTMAYWASFSTRLPPVPPIGFVTKVELDEVDCPPNGRFLVPKFRRVRELTRDEAQPLILERDRRLADWKADIADSVVTGETGDGDVGGGAVAEPYLTAPGEEPF